MRLNLFTISCNNSFYSDSQGRYAFTLEPGRYRVLAGNDMVVAGGTSAQSDECVVTAGSTTVCNITLIAPNVTGTVRINGEVASASVEFLKEGIKGFDYGAATGTYQNGEYALKVTAGTYRPRIYLYSSGNYILGPPCVVPDNGTVIWDELDFSPWDIDRIILCETAYVWRGQR